MSRKNTKNFFAAAVVAAGLCLAAPAQAADLGGASSGLLERLISWMAENWLAADAGDVRAIVAEDGGYIDPNGGGPKPGSCQDDPGCNQPGPSPSTQGNRK